MTERSVTHATFTLERTYEASPERVYQAFADPEIKQRWFRGPEEWGPGTFESDFRVGGHESSTGGPEGMLHRFDATYYDIVPNERIIISYEMHLNDQKISVSLQTIELEPAGNHTLLTLTEYGAYLDGADGPEMREHGTRELLEAVAAELERQQVAG